MTDRCELNTGRPLDTRDALNRVLDYARALGLHGVAILSPRCIRCGELHDFQMVTDLADTPADDTALRDLLHKFAAVSMLEPTEVSDSADRPGLS